MNDTFDAIIVGAGPAGLSAASVLATHKLSVCLIDDQTGPGGQVWRNSNLVHQWPGVSYSPSSSVIDVSTDVGAVGGAIDGTKESISVTWLQHVSDGKVMKQTHARALIIATGAMERPVLFPGSQLPGVMGIGAVQSVFKQARLVPRGPGVVLAGHGPLLLLTAQQIIEQGASIDAVLDLSIPGTRQDAAKLLPRALIAHPSLLYRGVKLQLGYRRLGIRVWKNVTALQALGNTCVEQVHFVSDGIRQTLPARLLAVHDGVLPNTQMTQLLILEHRWNQKQQSFAPVTKVDGQSSHPQIWIAGDGAGIAGVDLAVRQGRLTGMSVAHALNQLSGSVAKPEHDSSAHRLRRNINRQLPARCFIDTLYPPLPVDHLATDDTIVCRCEAITLSTIRTAITQGASGPNRVKTFTRCGMGACQGRQCGTNLTRIIAKVTEQSAGSIGALRIRPPLKPTLIADYLGLDIVKPQNEEADA